MSVLCMPCVMRSTQSFSKNLFFLCSFSYTSISPVSFFNIVLESGCMKAGQRYPVDSRDFNLVGREHDSGGYQYKRSLKRNE